MLEVREAGEKRPEINLRMCVHVGEEGKRYGREFISSVIAFGFLVTGLLLCFLAIFTYL